MRRKNALKNSVAKNSVDKIVSQNCDATGYANCLNFMIRSAIMLYRVLKKLFSAQQEVADDA